jgi:subtilisin family serine protease
MKKISILLGMLFLLLAAYSQKYVLVQFSSPTNIPTATYSSVSKTYSITSADVQIQNTFGLFGITKFEKEYPHAYLVKHPYASKLDCVYRIGTSTGIDSLYSKLKTLKSASFEGSIDTISNSISLALPNDNNLNCFPYSCHTYCISQQTDLINAPAAWDITTGNPNIRIAILDANFRRTHEELVGKVVIDQATPFNPAGISHGTATSVLAAGNTNNAVGSASIGYNCKLDLYNLGNSDYDEMLQAAINGARVINCSWFSHGVTPITTQQMAIDMIHDVYNVVIVAAAGNVSNGGYGNHVDLYPASYNHVISVSTVGHVVDLANINLCSSISIKDVFYNNLTNYVHYTSNANVDLCAPGYNVYIAYNISDNFYTQGNGSSYSSPMVAGAAALILSVNPNLTPEDVEAILKCTARDVYEIPYNISFLNELGHGRIDAGKAIQLAQTWVTGSAPTQQPPPTDIRWFEILSNGINTIEVESNCSANTNPGYCNIGYRLQVVAPNPSLTFKWLTFYSENNVGVSNNIRYGNSIYLSRGVDYPFINNGLGSLKACVRVNECIPSIYYAEDRASACLGDGCTYNCPADIYITGNYSTPLKESYTWVKSTGQTTISPTTSVKLDGSPTQGYVEFKPATGADYVLAEPTGTGEFIVQAYNGCDAGAPSFANTIPITEVTDGQITVDKLTVYPNPTNGLFYVECKNVISSIQVYNTQGSLVLEKQMNNVKKVSQKIAIDLSSFPSGVYILRSKGENFNYKIVKL